MFITCQPLYFQLSGSSAFVLLYAHDRTCILLVFRNNDPCCWYKNKTGQDTDRSKLPM